MSEARTGWTARELMAPGAVHGRELGDLPRTVNARPHTGDEVRGVVLAHLPPPELAQRVEPVPCEWNITGDTDDERENVAKLVETMDDADGSLFWHAKGATPIHDPLPPDTDGVQIVPLNMAEPVLFVRGTRNATNLGFAPHGAGGNTSRTTHGKRLAGRADADVFTEETAGLDVRFRCGRTDVSELPSAYKDAASVQADMARFGPAEVVDRVLPHGSIMAGDREQDAPWKARKREKLARRAANGGPDGHQENAR